MLSDFVVLIVVFSVVVENCVRSVVSALITYVDTAEVPRYGHTYYLSVFERDAYFGREVLVCAVKLCGRDFNVGIRAVCRLDEHIRSVKVVLDVTARCRGRFLITVTRVPADSCERSAVNRSERIDDECVYGCVPVSQFGFRCAVECRRCALTALDVDRYIDGRRCAVAVYFT